MNKVEFGISNLHIGTYSVATDGTVTLGTPYHQAGAVGFSPEASDDKTDFYADNMAYWSNYNSGPTEGDIEVALFDDTFKSQYLGYRSFSGGGLAEVKNPVKPSVYLMFEIDGDAEKRRVIYYNASLGSIKREYHTTEESKEPVTETLPVSVTGDNGSGIVRAIFKPGDGPYTTMFTSPPTPALTT